MLIYNFEKNFLGIDEHDLRVLGFQDFASLRAEASDFADLFVKTPGYIHNFKHVHWIDFIACAESNEDSKVIIHANNRTFKCTLDLKTIYLIDNPSAKAFAITLQNLRELTNNENKNITSDILEKPASINTQTTVVTDVFNSVPDIQKPVTKDPYEINIEEDAFDQPAASSIVEDIYENDDVIELEVPQEPEVDTEPQEDKEPEVETVENDFEVDIDVYQAPLKELAVKEEEEDSYESSYIYDPNVASNELGLPVDLIEEFIQDFIAQAKEFKDDLYNAVETSDMDKLKIQSHKLKGVAANLRIEDAFNVLAIINSSTNIDEIQKNLNIFYKIIANLAGEKSQSQQPAATLKIDEVKLDSVKESEYKQNDDEELLIDFKDELNVETHTLKEETPFNEDDFILEFKDEAPADLYMDYEDSSSDETLNLEIEEEFEEPQASVEVPVEVPQVVKEELKQEFLYDKKIAASAIGLDIETFNELFLDYIEGCKVSSTEIAKAIEKDDYQAWRTNAIQIKGMSDNMRVDDLTAPLEVIMSTKEQTTAREALQDVDLLIEKISEMGA